MDIVTTIMVCVSGFASFSIATGLLGLFIVLATRKIVKPKLLAASVALVVLWLIGVILSLNGYGLSASILTAAAVAGSVFMSVCMLLLSVESRPGGDSAPAATVSYPGGSHG